MVEYGSPRRCDLKMWISPYIPQKIFMIFSRCHQGYQAYGSGKSVRAAGGVYMAEEPVRGVSGGRIQRGMERGYGSDPVRMIGLWGYRPAPAGCPFRIVDEYGIPDD
jgi:hypothetical protein